MTVPIPIRIHRDDRQIVIAWSESHEGVYLARELRLACQCAECREEFSGRLLLDPATVPADVRPLRITLVGGYGFRIDWSDGHHTGIFTYQYLHDQCPCPRCVEEREPE